MPHPNRAFRLGGVVDLAPALAFVFETLNPRSSETLKPRLSTSYNYSPDRITYMTAKPLTFQELILKLQDFWARQGCVLQQPLDVEVGAGTMSPETFLRVLG